MQRFQFANSIEEQYLVRDLDEALRRRRRKHLFPWTLQKSVLKVFDDVLEYPVATDHDELAYLDLTKETSYENKPRYRYTSLQQFYEDPDNRNQMAEIWDAGTKYLGVRYKDIVRGTKLLNEAETVDDWSVSGDATAVVLDNVVFKKGNGSMKVSITNSTNTATIKNTFTAFSDSNYKRKYHFKWIKFADTVPTSLVMRLQTDDSNYLQSGTITTQFSGQAFKANAWNLIGYDLNTATETGTFDSASIASEVVVLTGASTGTYYFDESNLKEWEEMDYWYYSQYNIKTNSASVGDQKFFFESEAYSTDSALIGDDEWADVVMFDALLTSAQDKENKQAINDFLGKLADAENSLYEKYPDLVPIPITNSYNFINDFNEEALNEIYD